jgi:hypothetical protein
MNVESDDEFGQIAEEHQILNGNAPDSLLDKGDDEVRIPAGFFPATGGGKKEMAEVLANMSGFRLSLGPRASVEIIPVMHKETVDGLVGKCKDSVHFMRTFMEGNMKQCAEIVLYVEGPGTMVLVPDVSNKVNVPARFGVRAATPSSRTFVGGGVIEVSKTFSCAGSADSKVTKHYAAKVHSFVIRCVTPCKLAGKGHGQIFGAASLSCIHIGATGTGMSVSSSPI